MKTVSTLCLGFVLVLFCASGYGNTSSNAPQNENPTTTSVNTLTLTSSPELWKLTHDWANEFGALNPEVKIILTGEGEAINDQSQALYFYPYNHQSVNNDKSNWKMMVAHDAIIPVINANNPFRNQIYQQGLSASGVAKLLNSDEKADWNQLLAVEKSIKINAYIIDDETIKTNIARFGKSLDASFNTWQTLPLEDFIAKMQTDIYAIGFCKLSDIRELASNEITKGIALFPIDKNGNGQIDNFENIYENLNTFTRGVWIGKYPGTLSEGIYAVASEKPTDENTVSFLSWILADGQQFLGSNGYCELASIDRQANMDMLTGTTLVQNQPQANATSRSLLYLLALVGLAILFIVVIRRYNIQKIRTIEKPLHTTEVFNLNSIAAPKGLYFDKTHTWAYMEQNGNVRLGIDDFLQHVTGPLTRIKLKETGEEVRKGEKIMTIIRNGKQLNVYAPISGTIRAQNAALNNDTSLLANTPYTKGWIYMIEPKNWIKEIQFLFMGERYQEWIKEEYTRLKDFFAATSGSSATVQPQYVYQDGGEIIDHVLADMAPEVWEEFQVRFMDTSK
jgi:glycine cleavage system H lipoate-binding protein/ABC-type phosphate transport system substrate-binding protein